MAQGNVPISLLLDSNGKEQSQMATTPDTPASLQTREAASQFQPAIEAKDSSIEASLSPLPLDLTSKSAPRAIAPARRGRPSTNPHSGQLHDQLKSFQTNFRALGKKTPSQQKIVFKPPKSSRASITSIINVEDNGGEPAVTPQTEKKRRAPKAEGLSKRAKSETAKKPTKAELRAAEQKAPEPNKTAIKNKSPELAPNPLEKIGVHATMTAEKKRWPHTAPSVADPSIVEGGETNMRLIGRDEEGKDLKEVTLPVIVLDVPLLDPKDPKPGKAEVVVHVMKMAEEKYGWNTVHPNSKSAIDLLDEMLEDEDDGEDDEEEETAVDEKSKKKEENTKDKKKKKVPKVNRKVGKYDKDDPFIDDTELQWEEEITTTKEGFFVYWGPLVDDRGTGNTRKLAPKNKK